MKGLSVLRLLTTVLSFDNFVSVSIYSCGLHFFSFCFLVVHGFPFDDHAQLFVAKFSVSGPLNH